MAVGDDRSLVTPGGRPGGLASLAAQVRNLVGASDKPSRRTFDRESVNFYDQIVEYYYRRRGAIDGGWRVCEEEYNRGKGVDERAYELQELAPSRAYSLVATVESMVLANRPKFFLEGYTAEDHEEYAPVLETALNNEWRNNFELVKETRLCVRDCAKYGFGVMLTSYEGDFDPEEMTETASSLRNSDPILQAAADEAEAQLADMEASLSPEELETTYEDDDRVVRGRAISRRISPWEFLVDPDATCLQDAKWVGRVIVADIESVRNDPMLKNTEGIAPNSSFDMDGRFQHLKEYRNLDATIPYDFVFLYEIFIRDPVKGWKMKVMAEGHDKFLREMDMPYWIGQPYQVLRWNEDGESFFPQSDIQLVMTEIIAERLLLTKVFDGYSREHVDTTFYDDRLGISEEELYAAGDPSVGKYVGVNGGHLEGNMTLAQAFYKMPKDAKSPEALNVLAMIERSMQISSGLGPNQMGQALKSGTTATEAAEVGTFSRSRGAHKFSAVEEFIAGIAEQRLGIMAQFYSTTDMRRIVGAEMARTWAGMNWTKADVQHGLRVNVEPGSTRQETEEGRVNQMITMLGAIMQNPLAQTLFDIPEMYRELFRRMGFHEGSKFLIMEDGEEFAQQAAEYNALMGGGGGGGGSAPSVPGGTPGQIAAGEATI